MKKAINIFHKGAPTSTTYRVRWDDKETYVIVTNAGDLKDFGVGRAVRADEDAKDYRIGVKLALERALRNFETDRDERRRFIRDFYKHWPEAHPENNPPKGPRVGDVIAKIKDGEITYKTPKKGRVAIDIEGYKKDPMKWLGMVGAGAVVRGWDLASSDADVGRCTHTLETFSSRGLRAVRCTRERNHSGAHAAPRA